MSHRGEATEAPQFVSHAEWQRRRRASARRSMILVCAAIAAAALAGLLYTLVPSFYRNRTIADAARWLRAADRLHIVAREPDKDAIVFEEWIDGGRFSLQRACDGFRYVCEANSATSIGPTVAFRSSRELGPIDPRDLLVEWLDTFSLFSNERTVREAGMKAIDGIRCRGVTAETPNTRLVLWLEPVSLRPVQIQKEFFGANQWETDWVATIRADGAPPASAFATEGAVEQTAFELAAAQQVSMARQTVGDPPRRVAVRDVSVGRTGILFVLVDLPNLGPGIWEARGDDTLNGIYLPSRINESLLAADQKTPAIPRGSTLFILMPAARRPQFVPTSISVSLDFTPENAPKAALPELTMIERRIEKPDCDIAPNYLYAYRSADCLNRRLITAQELSWGTHASRVRTAEGPRSTPDGSWLTEIASQSLLNVVRANGDSIPIQTFSRIVDVTRDRLRHLNATGSIGYLGPIERRDEYEGMFSIRATR